MALRPCKECNQQISSHAKVCPHCGKKVGMGTGSGCLIVILVVIVLVVLFFAIPFASHHSQNGVVSSPTVDPKSMALSQVSLDFKWRKEAFDNVMETDFTVKNGSNYNIKDFEITCRHYAKSGTEIDHNTRTVYDIVKAHSTKKFMKFNMGFIHSQAAQSSCAVTDLNIAP
jgi:hypothetical protein